MCKSRIRREESEKGSQKIFKEIMSEIFPNVLKNGKVHI